MNPFIERTEDHLYTTWADINWHAVEENVRNLQERIYRATTNKALRTDKNLQKYKPGRVGRGNTPKDKGQTQTRGHTDRQGPGDAGHRQGGPGTRMGGTV